MPRLGLVDGLADGVVDGPTDAVLASILERARHRGGSFLLENESLAVVETLGLATPRHFFVESAEDVEQLALDRLQGARVVVKGVAAGLVHKTETGAVAVVEKRHHPIVEAIELISRNLANHKPAGCLVEEWIDHTQAVGEELLLSVRWSDDFGAVATLGPGGIQTEFLSHQLEGGLSAAILAPSLDRGENLEKALATKAFLSLFTQPQRGREPTTDLRQLAGLVRNLFAFAARSMPHDVAEIEINPLVFRDGVAIALDALVRLGRQTPRIAPPRPLDKLENLLRPRSIAIMGVSTRRNPGRIVLDNVLESGFDPEQIHIIKPEHQSLAGCSCVPDLESLPSPVDLAVLCIGASELPATVEEVIDGDRARTMILIAGGLGERPGSEGRGQALADLIRRSRRRADRGPLVNGGNCLGVRSVPGHYDTLFIPRHKLSYPRAQPAPLALVSQSGALAVAKASRLAELNPRYLISLGNQLDLTVADYLTYLEEDPELQVFACYVEGFRPLDGARWLEAASRITRSGRALILYRAGRTETGSRVAATHTASIAGDYAVTRELARAAGVLVAESLEEFEDLIRLACALDSRELKGPRLGALSNAGFECVAIADADGLRQLELTEFTASTSEALRELLAAHHLSAVVGIANPLDVTPILGDEAFIEASRLVLEDDNVDVGVVGCVPLTGALETLQAGAGHDEDIGSEHSVVRRLAHLWSSTTKAWVAVVDGGPIYDPMARLLATEGIPVFRSIDRATRLLSIYADWRLRSRR